MVPVLLLDLQEFATWWLLSSLAKEKIGQRLRKGRSDLIGTGFAGILQVSVVISNPAGMIPVIIFGFHMAVSIQLIPIHYSGV